MMLVFSQVIFSFFAYGLNTSWSVVVGGVFAQLFAVPLYNFSVSGVGLVTIAPLIGAINGAFISVNRVQAVQSTYIYFMPILCFVPIMPYLCR